MIDEYSVRSDIMPLMLMNFFSHQNPEFGYYTEQKNLMSEKYYPLDFGSFDKDRMMAQLQRAMENTGLLKDERFRAL